MLYPYSSKTGLTVKNLKHGGDIYTFAQQARRSKESIMDFSSNITPLGIPPLVEESYRESLSSLLQYPDPCARELCREIADQFFLEDNNVIAGNGAISLIDLTIRTFRPRQALLVEPCFNEYRRLLHLYGVQVREIFLKEEEDFNFSYQDILKGLEGTDMIILGHPNNPTGTALSRQEIVSLIHETKKRKILLLIDEAFVDWNPQFSVYQQIKHSSLLVVIRSLTKFFGLAGIRAGFALAQPHLIDRMRLVQEPWSCNALAQRLSISALRDIEFQKRSLHWYQEESRNFYQQLQSIPEVKVFPSLANFFLARVKNQEDEAVFWNFMKSKGIYLRNMEDIVGLDNRYFRFALKNREENLVFMEALKEALMKDRCLF